jgi:hypothetical protein
MSKLLIELGEDLANRPETTVVAGVLEEGPRSALLGAKRYAADSIPNGSTFNRAMRERFDARVARDQAWAALSEAEQKLLGASGPLIP